MLRRTATGALAGVVLALAFPPFSWWFVVPACVGAFVLAVRDLPARRAWLPGLAFGLAFQLVLTFWMRVIGWDAWIALSVLSALFYAALGPVAALAARLPGWPLWTAAAWVACEWCRTNGLTAWMPWGRISYAMVDSPVANAFSWVGGNGLSLLLALLGTTLAWAVLQRGPAGRGRLALAAGLVAASLAAVVVPGLAAYRPASTGTVTAAVVQGGVPGDPSDILASYRLVTRSQSDLTTDLARDVTAGRKAAPDVVVWPENSTAVDPFGDAETHDAIVRASRAIGVPILVGAMVDAPDPGQVLNQGIVWDPVSGPGDRYTKHHPVPMGEYVPFRSDVLTDWISELALVPRDMAAGTRLAPLRVDTPIGDLAVADAICFDVAFDDPLVDQVRRGAQLIVVQTSNASFIRSNQLDQQFAFTRARAIETGRSVVVASVNGISALIRPDGSVVDVAPRRDPAVLVGEVPLARGVTPGVVLGPAVGVGSVAVALLAALAGLVRGPVRRLGYGRSRRRREPDGETPVADHTEVLT